MDKKKRDDDFDVVIIRQWKRGGDLIALFPEIPADNEGNLCQSFEHFGQHGGADFDVVIRITKPVLSHDDFRIHDLLEELKRMGHKPKVVYRATQAMHEKRRNETHKQMEAARARKP